MTKTFSRVLWAQVTCLGFWPVLLLAGAPDPAANLQACKQGRPSCDRSQLGQQETIEVDLALHTRNMAECRGGGEGCDYSLLSPPEAAALAAAERLRNYTACVKGRGYCDRSRLTPAEAAVILTEPGVASPLGRQP
jgi:hypothetical protein